MRQQHSGSIGRLGNAKKKNLWKERVRHQTMDNTIRCLSGIGPIYQVRPHQTLSQLNPSYKLPPVNRRGGLCFLRFRKYSFAQNYYIFNCRKIVFNHIWSKSSPVFGGLYDVWSSKPTTTKSRKKVARLATHQFLSLRRVSPNFSWISWGFIAGNNHELLSSILGDICILYMREALPSGKSCLFAKMRIMASRISLSLMILKII